MPLYRLIYGFLQEDTHFVAFAEWQQQQQKIGKTRRRYI